MCDQDHSDLIREAEARGWVTRRQFGVLLGAGASMTLPSVINAQAVTEAEVMITTPDGEADCYFVHPASGSTAAVLVWPDIFGLRPAFRDMGRRLAESGYSVLVVNPFYRQQRAPTAPQGAATPIQQLIPMMQALTAETHMTDARAFIGWLDEQPSVDTGRRVGTQVTAWAGRSRFARRPPSRAASEPSPRSTAAGS